MTMTDDEILAALGRLEMGQAEAIKELREMTEEEQKAAIADLVKAIVGVRPKQRDGTQEDLATTVGVGFALLEARLDRIECLLDELKPSK